MKFEEAYQHLFLVEDERSSKLESDVEPTPDMFDVKPLPVRKPKSWPDQSKTTTSNDNNEEENVENDNLEENEPLPSSEPQTLMDYIQIIDQTIELLNGVDESYSLQKLVNQLDIQGSPFENIADKTSQDIIRSAEILSSLNEKLKGFLITSAKYRLQPVVGK